MCVTQESLEALSHWTRFTVELLEGQGVPKHINRRSFLKKAGGTALGAAALRLTEPALSAQTGQKPSFRSEWRQDITFPWPGPEYWANPLQDWRVHQGRLEWIRPYKGWPIILDQLDNGLWGAEWELDRIETTGVLDAVVQVQDESDRKVVYTLRITGDSFKPLVRKAGSYKVIACYPEGIIAGNG
jgi:hypothetical protein